MFRHKMVSGVTDSFICQLKHIHLFNSGLDGQEDVGFMGNVVLILKNATNNNNITRQ